MTMSEAFLTFIVVVLSVMALYAAYKPGRSLSEQTLRSRNCIIVGYFGESNWPLWKCPGREDAMSAWDWGKLDAEKDSP